MPWEERTVHRHARGAHSLLGFPDTFRKDQLPPPAPCAPCANGTGRVPVIDPVPIPLPAPPAEHVAAPATATASTSTPTSTWSTTRTVANGGEPEPDMERLEIPGTPDPETWSQPCKPPRP